MEHGSAKASFNAVCSPPLALLYKNTRKKGKPSFNIDVDLDDELCDALCKISKSSEELWKEISPPSPIGSKAITTADWMSLDAAVQHASLNPNASNIPRIEIEGPHDSSPFESATRYNPANYNNHLSRVPGRNSSSNLTAGIMPLKSPSPTSLSPTLPPPSHLNTSSEQPLSLPAPSSSAMSTTHLPVFSSAFANYANPTFGNNNASSAESFSNHTPSITTNSISISGNVNINIQNSSSSHSSSSSPHVSSLQASPSSLSVPSPSGSQSPTKKEARKPSAHFAAPYTSPQLKIHQYVPPGQPDEPSFNGSSNNTDKIRHRENEKLWGEVVLNCNKLKAHASRGITQTLAWGEINDAMNSTRHVMTSLLALLQLHSYAYENIYNSVPGYHPSMQNGPNTNGAFEDMPRFQFNQFEAFMNAHNFNMHMSPSVEIKKENNSPNVDSYHVPYNAPSAFGFDDNHRAKMARREVSTPETLVRSESAPNMSSNLPLSPIQNVMSLPNLNLSPVITALSNLNSMHSSSSLSGSADSIQASSSSDENTSSTPTRSYPTPTSGNATPSPEPAKSGNWNKKNRGKKRSKYADLDLMCLSCGVKQTPEWRRGPAGAKTLCNACGLHWAKVLKAEGKSGSAPDSKKAFLLEQKRNQFMLLAKRQDGSIFYAKHHPEVAKYRSRDRYECIMTWC